MTHPVTIQAAQFPIDQARVVDIFREYVHSATVNLAFQDYDREFATLPGLYAQPQGCVLLATRGPEVLGCIALRPVDATTCEMKRLYVRPNGRGQGLGRRLAEAVLNAARQAGYQRICLDVLPEFAAAQALYQQLGFSPAPAVSYNPVPGTQFLALAL